MIKVSMDVHEFIREAEEFYSYTTGWEDSMLEDHEYAINTNWQEVNKEALCMKEYSLEQLKDILYNGYKVELD